MAVASAIWGTFASTINSASVYTTTSNTLPAGAYLFIDFSSSSSLTTAGVSDSAGGTWSASLTPNTGSPAHRHWIRTTVGTGTAFIVTINTSGTTGYGAIVGTYFTGASGSVSTPTVASGTTTIPTLTSPSATQSGDLYHCAFVTRSGTPFATGFTAGSGYTLGTNVITGGAIQQYTLGTEYQSATGTGTVSTTASFTNTSTSASIWAIVIRAASVSTATTGTGAISIDGTGTVDSRINFGGWGIPLI